MEERRIKFYASLGRPFPSGQLSVRLSPVDYILWHRGLQDEIEVYIPIEQFIENFPDQWRQLNAEWERQIASGWKADTVEAEIELPVSAVLEGDRHLELIPIAQFDEHQIYQKICQAVFSGVWETDDGQVIELDADDSPFVKMGMI